MALGAVGYVLACQPDGTLTASVSPCVDVAGAFYKPVVVQAYTLVPSAQEFLDPLEMPFDYTLAGGFFAFGIGTVGAVYLFAWGMGEIINMIGHAK